MRSAHLSLLLIALSSLAAPSSSSSSCDGRTQGRCNFICDCWDCADERDCGYHRDSPVWGRPFSCDFEYDDCGWKDISTSDYRWVRDQRISPIWRSRPHSDHTLGNRWGWSMMAEGQSGKSAVSARLQSPVMRDAAATCEVHIHYHMYSADSPQMNGSLSIHLADQTQTYAMWESTQSSAMSWRRVVVYTGRIPGDFQIIVTASRDTLSQGDFSVDDLEFRHCSLQGLQAVCGLEQHRCLRGSCVDDGARCDGTDDCGDKSDESDCGLFQSCSFEKDVCTWKSTWERVDGYNGEPERDHTTNSRAGFFLRAPQSGAHRLQSPPVQADGALPCYLVFYYYMDGSDAASLSVGYRLAGSDQDNVELKLQGRRGALWIREKVSFNQLNQPFQVFIEGSGNGSSGVLAVDDLIFSPGCAVQNESAGSVISSAGQDGAVWSVREACTPATDSSVVGWTDVSIGAYKWGRSTTGSPLTVLNAEGNLKTEAESRSSLLCPTGPSCINMTYYLHTGHAGFISLSAWDPQLDTHSHVWHSRGEQSNAWKSLLIPLGEQANNFQLVLSGAVDPGPVENWSAAVSEIKFVSCEESTEDVHVTCNFENGPCGWYQDVTAEIDWEWGTSSDHTTGHGRYMFVAGASRSERGTKARLLSYLQSVESETSCLSFHHRMFGPDTGTLNLYSKYNGGEEMLIWTSTGTRGNLWHREIVTLNTTNKYQLIFEAVRDGSIGHIAIDDIAVMSGPCAAPTRCSFEAGTCGFSSHGTYIWRLHETVPFSHQPGPVRDHTLQSFSGHYMAVDTSSSTLPSKSIALLTSSMYNAYLDHGCLSFWYQMGGTSPGTLIVSIEDDIGKKKVKREILRISDAKPGSWRYGSAALQVEVEWKLLLEAVGAGGEHAYIAIDDIHIGHHRCHESASCDFEWGSCSWSNVRIPLMDTYDWDWTNGAAVNRPSAAPEKDRSLGSAEGHYAFVDTGALHMEGASAWLLSEHLSATAGSCFTFSYCTDNSAHFHLGELVLYVAGAEGLLHVWALHGFHSGDWQEEKLQLNSTGEFQIIFEVMKGTRPHTAIIALDNLTYTPDRLCNTVQIQKGTDNSGQTWAIVIGVIIVALCLLLIFLLYRRWRRSVQSAPSFPEQVDDIDGFDNVTYDIDSSNS